MILCVSGRLFMKEQNVFLLVFRGFGYAMTAFITLIAGALINESIFSDTKAIAFLLTLWIISLPFYIIYAYNYNYDYKDDIPDKYKTILFVAFCVILILLSLLIFIFSFGSFDYFIPYLPLLAVHLFVIILLCFHFNKLRKDQTQSRTQIRNCLIVPVVYSIGINFCLSFSVNNIITSKNLIAAYIPYVLFALYYLIIIKYKDKIDAKKYCFLNFGIVLLLLLVVLLLWLFDAQILETIKSLLLSIALSAFVASFEAWRITEHVIKHLEEKDNSTVRKNAYYKATTLALSISLLCIPLLLLFTEMFYLLFYILIISMGIFACFFWIAKGIDTEKFVKINWVKLKNWLGFSILLIIATDALTKIQIPEFLFTFYDFFQFSSLFVVMGVFFYLGKSFLNDYFHYQEQVIENSSAFSEYKDIEKFKYIILETMANDPWSYSRLIGIISSLPFVVLFIIDIILNKTSNVENYKNIILQMRAVEVIYICISIACILFDIIRKIFSFRRDDIELPKDMTSFKDNHKESFKKIIGFVKLVRFPTCIFINLIVSIPLLIRNKNIALSILSGLPFMLAAMTGFALNDCLDFRKDKISKPHRAIPSNLITMGEALLIAVLLGILSFVFSIYMAHTLTHLFLYLFALVGVIVYNLIIKYAAIFKTLSAALICVLPIVYVATFEENILHTLPIAVMTYIYILGREIRMDILDYDGDKAENIKTLPILFGNNFSAIISQILIYSAILLSCVLLIYKQTIVCGIIFVFVILLSQLTCELLWRSKSVTLKRKSIILQWIPMLTSFFLCI